MGKRGEDMSRKRKIIIFILVVLAVGWLLSYCLPIRGSWSTGRIVYKVDYDEVSFEEELTEEEMSAVLRILRRNRVKIPIGYTSGCMWEWGVVIVIDNVRYMLATDDCGTIFVGGWGLMDISLEERAVLEKMFTSRGATFP
jgi:hypothetical protein